jgi:hypothetical protein
MRDVRNPGHDEMEEGSASRMSYLTFEASCICGSGFSAGREKRKGPNEVIRELICANPICASVTEVTVRVSQKAIGDHLDLVAIERALSGDHEVRLTMEEYNFVWRTLENLDLSARDIADKMNTTERSIFRYRDMGHIPHGRAPGRRYGGRPSTSDRISKADLSLQGVVA